MYIYRWYYVLSIFYQFFIFYVYLFLNRVVRIKIIILNNIISYLCMVIEFVVCDNIKCSIITTNNAIIVHVIVWHTVMYMYVYIDDIMLIFSHSLSKLTNKTCFNKGKIYQHFLAFFYFADVLRVNLIKTLADGHSVLCWPSRTLV